MNNVRAIIIFVVFVFVAGILIFAFSKDNYVEIERINQYVLYEKDVDVCIDKEYEGYLIVCENKYLLRSGLYRVGLVDGIEEELVRFDEIEAYIEYEDAN